MPAHNEEMYLRDAVARVVEGLRRRSDPFEIIVVQNGSTDATSAVAAALAAEAQEVSTIDLARANYGAAVRAGLLAARGDWVVVFDVDFVDLGFLDRALSVAGERGAAIVVGSKRSPGADDQRNAGRNAVTAIFSLVLRAGFGLTVSDTHGLKLLRRAQVFDLVGQTLSVGELFDTELVLRAERSGLGVVEIPVSVADQRPPRTSIWRRIPRSLSGLVRLRIALWRVPSGKGVA